MAKKHIIRFNGQRFRYIKNSKTENYGYCDRSTDKRTTGVIAIKKGLKGRIALDTNIHEMLHALNYYRNEKDINDTARQIAAALWELGYRNINEIDKDQQKKRKQRNV